MVSMTGFTGRSALKMDRIRSKSIAAAIILLQGRTVTRRIRIHGGMSGSELIQVPGTGRMPWNLRSFMRRIVTFVVEKTHIIVGIANR